MITEAIILAGGKGTRLQSVVNNVPKPMALVAGKPFLTYVLDNLINQGIKKIVLSVGYKANLIQDYFKNCYKDIPIEYVIETSPLGTGGALKFAINTSENENILAINGDTIFHTEYQKLFDFHYSSKAGFSMALRQINSDGRYGGVKLDNSNTVTGFTSKEIIGNIIINSGIYIINKNFFEENTPIGNFSIEDDFFTHIPSSKKLKGIILEGYFIDIGIPEDYYKADRELPLVVNG
jgi:D-glycero-alpha-D-manno-heptose 1-phosphate guanylyltransferase